MSLIANNLCICAMTWGAKVLPWNGRWRQSLSETDAWTGAYCLCLCVSARLASGILVWCRKSGEGEKMGAAWSSTNQGQRELRWNAVNKVCAFDSLARSTNCNSTAVYDWWQTLIIFRMWYTLQTRAAEGCCFIMFHHVFYRNQATRRKTTAIANSMQTN